MRCLHVVTHESESVVNGQTTTSTLLLLIKAPYQLADCHRMHLGRLESD